MAKPAQRFQMLSWEHEDGWEPMENGAASSVWRPRPTEVEAIAKCMAWTGFLYIPAMEVVDLASDTVVWRRVGPYTDAGPEIAHPNEHLAVLIAKSKLESNNVPAAAASFAPEPDTPTLW